jgi:hypothetical protein
MEGLINAIAQALAAVLEGIGVAGRSRRRAGIQADLDLLKELEGFPDLAAATVAYTALQNRIIVDVMMLAGVDLRTSRRDIPWSSVVFTVLLAAGFGYWTAVLSESGFRWYSLFPGVFAGLMFVSILGMLGRKVEASPGDGPDEMAAGEQQPQVRN